MTGQLITSDHKTYTLPSLLRWEIVYTGSVPCDSYSVTFLYDASMAERRGLPPWRAETSCCGALWMNTPWN